jgi:hypothetical protein
MKNLTRLIPIAIPLALLACGPAESPEPEAPVQPVEVEPEPEAEPALGPPKGEYTCRVMLAGEPQPDARCVITEGDLPESLWLDTLEGEMLISGEVSPVDGSSFELAGDVMCPQGACYDELDMVFSSSGAGAFEGRAEISAGELVVELSR